MKDLIKKEIEKVIKRADFDVFKSDKFGDYSSNVAMVLKKDPEEIAKSLKTQDSRLKTNLFEKIEVAGPGFINFWLSEKGLEKGLENLNKKPAKKDEKIQVEFISVNPTGEYHIGHGRGAFYGDVLSNVLDATGHKVEREFFINDSKESTQIKELGKTALGKGKTYLTENLKSQISKIKSKIKKTDDEGEAGYLLAQKIQKDNQKFIKKDLRIDFDTLFSEERDLRQKELLKKTMDLLKEKKVVYEKDGATWLKTSDYGDDEDRVVIRSNGDYTYFLSDIAYHTNKFERGYDKVIDIWGADHQGHIKRMLAAKKMLNWKGDLDILISQMAAVKEGGKTKKLSKRKGTLIFLKDLIKEVGLDVCRWFYLEKSLSTQMEFDMALAKEQSKKNPVYYVQYAHARMCSILAKSEARNSKSETKFKNLNTQERNLVLKLIQFAEVVEDTAEDYQVQRLTTYVYELAKIFTDFYENVPVLKAETEELKKSRLAMVFFTRKILERVLGLLGISAPEKM
ncbi:MAG: arginine--tRNA ligase [Candidatus Parcubacteria bacterium]|nr:arginine--tRNA ligase [Candidatus Parcubacteria bacterium]